MKFTIDGSMLGKNITGWAKRKAGVAADLHTLVVSCICHAVAHGDTTYINKLDEAAQDGTDVRGKTASSLHLSGMREFFVEYGPVRWVRADRKNNKPEHFAYDKAKAETLQAQYKANPDGFRDSLLGTPFWRLKSQKEFEGFNLRRILNAALSRIERIKKDPDKATHEKNDFTGESELRQVLAKLPPLEAKAA